jgi:AraC-like DNA-binding protein
MLLDFQSTKNRTIINFIKEGYSDLCVLGRYRYNAAKEELRKHIHKGMIEICYCAKGRQLFMVNHKQYFVKGGDVFIHFPDEVHSSGGMPEEKGCLYWLKIKTSSGAKGKGQRNCPNLDYLLEKIIKKKSRHFHGGPDLQKILESIFESQQSADSKEIRRIRLELQIGSFLLKLLEKINNDTHQAVDGRLQDLLHYITINLSEQLNISTLARKVNLSQSRFKNWFREQTGFTPGDYIQRQRIDAAIKMMRQQPGTSLTDIAYHFNFSTPQYFATVMKKYTGKTPSKIRDL